MAAATEIWTCVALLPALKCGGWACVRRGPDGAAGSAGGERGTTSRRLALAALAAALKALPTDRASGGAPLAVRTPLEGSEIFAEILKGLGGPPPPGEDLELWRDLVAAAGGRPLALISEPVSAGAPLAFTLAWAEFARDKARARGAFSAPIPKANLANLPR